MSIIIDLERMLIMAKNPVARLPKKKIRKPKYIITRHNVDNALKIPVRKK